MATQPTHICPAFGQRFIVAEITKNWTRGQIEAKPLLCQEFETVINHNLSLGYRLHSFQLHQLMTNDGSNGEPEVMTETIIAVFERI